MSNNSFLAIGLLILTQISFGTAMEAPSGKSDQELTKEKLQQKAIQDFWSAREGKMEGEFTEKQGKEDLPLDVKKNIQKYSGLLNKEFFTEFTCPSAQKIQEIYDKNKKGDHKLIHDGINFIVDVLIEGYPGTITFDRVEINKDMVTCSYNTETLIGTVYAYVSDEHGEIKKMKCTVEGGRKKSLRDINKKAEDVKITCE